MGFSFFSTFLCKLECAETSTGVDFCKGQNDCKGGNAVKQIKALSSRDSAFFYEKINGCVDTTAFLAVSLRGDTVMNYKGGCSSMK